MSSLTTALFDGALVSSFTLNYEAKTGPTFGSLTHMLSHQINPLNDIENYIIKYKDISGWLSQNWDNK